jgi:hypothetical protein
MFLRFHKKPQKPTFSSARYSCRDRIGGWCRSLSANQQGSARCSEESVPEGDHRRHRLLNRFFHLYPG